MNSSQRLLNRLMNDESGQDLIEYGLVAAVIALGAVASLGTLSNSIRNVYNSVSNSLTNAV